MDHGTTAALSQIAIVMAAAFAGGALVRRLNQPVLVGYILVGLLLGPSVLGIMSNPAEISFMAELGILLLMFIIGMELDARRFAAVYKVAISTTLLQIGASLLLMTFIGYLLDWTPARIVIFGFAFSLSSTAVAIKLLEDMGQLNKPVGNTAIGILVAQDLALIPMLLIVGSLQAEGGFNTWGLIKLGVAVLVLGGILFGMSRHGWTLKDMAPSWLHWPAFRSDDQRALAALAFCFTSAAIAGALELSASYGAFLSGLLIGSTAQSHAYEKQIKPVFDLLIMVFFLSVGLLLDVHFIMRNILTIAIMLGALMMMKTFFNIFVLSKLGLSRRHAFLIGTSLGQMGEFSFVLVALGLSLQAIYAEEYKLIVALIAFSLVLTPLWMFTLERMHFIHKDSREPAIPEPGHGDAI
jgi:CPA2 family monovalent cation:H+ antiporter-2